MKKKDIAKVSLAAMSMPSLLATLAGGALVLSAGSAYGQVTCTPGTTTTAVFCNLATGGYVAKASTMTGSVGVVIDVADTTTGFAACGAHLQGSGNKFGLSTFGGSLQTVTGSAYAAPTAVLGTASGGCA